MAVAMTISYLQKTVTLRPIAFDEVDECLPNVQITFEFHDSVTCIYLIVSSNSFVQRHLCKNVIN